MDRDPQILMIYRHVDYETLALRNSSCIHDESISMVPSLGGHVT